MKFTLANILMHAVHLAVIVFCVVGWIWPETRPWHLALCGLTLFSWFVLGPLLDELGFCFLTGIQNLIWKRRGQQAQPSYMVFLYERITGRPAPAKRVALVTQLVLYSCTLLSLVLFMVS